MFPRSLTIKNFRSFRGAQVFNFPEQPGLYFMRGDNRVDDRLGGNGAGKSTVWDALHWVCFNRTAEGLKAGQVCNWSTSKGVEVSLSYDYGAGTDLIDVRRTWGPISWTLSMYEDDLGQIGGTTDLTKAEQNPFLADLGLTELLFQNVVMMAQGEPMFLDLKKDAQAELFGRVLGLDKWLEYSARASKMATGVDNECRRLESEVARLQGRLDVGHDYSRDIQEFEHRRKARIDELAASHDFINSGIVADKAKIAELEKELDAQEILLREDRGLMESRKLNADTAERVIKQMGVALAEHVAELRQLEKQIRTMAEDEVCPTCGLDVNKHPDAHRMIDDLKTKAEALAAEVRKGTNAVDAATKEKERAATLLQRAEDQYNDTRRGIDQIDANLRNLRMSVNKDNKRLDDIEEDIDRLEREANPYKDKQAELHDRQKATQEELRQAQRMLDAFNERHGLLSHWVRGFKELRLQQIAEALTEFEIEANSALDELGLGGWELRFDVDRETGSGSIQRGFTVTVRSPENAEYVPWASWSGGERQRLRIAAQMGLSNLIRSRMGVALPLEIWDEPSRGLSPEGIQDLLRCLERRARVEGRIIYIVDHTAHAFGGFAGTTVIVKDAQGSRIEQT